MAESTVPYRVLARKYRPQRFDQLIGQDAMVVTLGNAIRRDRIAHAFLLTGVRGVGKTSTARLIAKALNCIGPDGQGGATIDPCGVCEPCVAIAEGRHIDVVEMDAASHTGVDDVREIIEAVRYAAVSARYKIYIIDEVHMLSKNAFNALLKTLEEPPAHVKFLFATTEVQKVPVTVLSRCQRFDLRRIPADLLGQHFAKVLEMEQVAAEPEALALIARAAEGSARDGLSILDQAIAHANGEVTAAQVREMLGLSDRGAIRTLFGLLMEGKGPDALAALRAQHDLGVDPLAVFRGLLEVCHGITRIKAGGGDDPALSVEEREAYAEWASSLGFGTLHRIWQLLLKGHGEVVSAPMPLAAAEMALLRIIYASTLPDPGELARKLVNGEPVQVPADMQQPSVAPAPAEASAPLLRMPTSFVEMVDMLEANGHRSLAEDLRIRVGLVRFEPPELDLASVRTLLDADFSRKVAAALKDMTGQSWLVSILDKPAEPSIVEQEKAAAGRERDAVLATPIVQAAYAAFPDAELVDYTTSKRSMSQ